MDARGVGRHSFCCCGKLWLLEGHPHAGRQGTARAGEGGCLARAKRCRQRTTWTADSHPDSGRPPLLLLPLLRFSCCSTAGPHPPKQDRIVCQSALTCLPAPSGQLLMSPSAPLSGSHRGGHSPDSHCPPTGTCGGGWVGAGGGAGQGRAGVTAQGRTGQGRAGQDRAGQRLVMKKLSVTANLACLPNPFLQGC